MLTIFYWSFYAYACIMDKISMMKHGHGCCNTRLDAISIAILTVCMLIDLATYAYRHRKYYSELI